MRAAAIAELCLASALAGLGGALGGWLAGSAGAAGGALGLYALWHLVHLVLLLRSLTRPLELPDTLGLWAELYARVYRHQREVQARERLNLQRLSRFEETSAALPDAAVVLGADDTIRWCNEAAQRFLGLRPAQDLGQRLTHVVRHPDFVSYLERGGGEAGVEFPAPVNQNLTLQAQYVSQGGGRHLLVVRDVTPLRRLDQVRRDFVANASHELRTPLTVIYGFIESLDGERAQLPALWRRPIALMREQALRMQRILDELLQLARLDSAAAPPGTPVNVPALLEQLRLEAQALSGARGHVLEFQVDGGLWLRGNASELRSALGNLVSNAVQHTPDGTRIDVSWAAGAQGGAQFAVRDHGEGIAPEHLPRLTERFYRVDAGRSRAQGGTGLGLAIVKHALGRHGAELLIESELHRGSRFSCVFPRALSCSPAAPEPQVALAAIGASSDCHTSP